MGILRNKKGFSYILTCVLVLAVVMMIAVSVQYSLVFSCEKREGSKPIGAGQPCDQICGGTV